LITPHSSSGTLLTIRTADEREFKAISKFFVYNWWPANTAEGQRRQLEMEELDDFRRSYGELVGRRKVC
jgi:hypothetical protein